METCVVNAVMVNEIMLGPAALAAYDGIEGQVCIDLMASMFEALSSGEDSRCAHHRVLSPPSTTSWPTA